MEHPPVHRLVHARPCLCCQAGRQRPPDVPPWVVALYRLLTADFCTPKSSTRKHEKKQMLHNSATTCDMSDDDSSFGSLDEALLGGTKSGTRTYHPWQSPTVQQRHHATGLTTPKQHLQRPRLMSGTSLTLSCRTTDSRHRRSNLQELPTPDQIWRPAKVIHTRGVSAVTQLTMPSLSDHSNNSNESISLDLSESEAGDSVALIEGESSLVLNRSFVNHMVAQPPPTLTKHQRNPSYCSSASESEATSKETLGGPAQTKVTERALQVLEETQEDPAKADWTLDWLKGDSADAAAFCGKPCTAIVPSEPKREPTYLPIYPIPPAASVSMTASIFSAGWCAVFYDLQPLGICEVPKITGENICFLQLLSGGMLQLTSAVDGDRKTVLVSPKASGSNLKLLSKRIGHCLVLETAASTSFNPQQTLFVLPINFPSHFREELTTYFSGGRFEPPELPGNDLFFPNARPSQQRYPPNPQHEAAIHLSFAMDAALRLDETTRRRRW